MHKNKLKGKFKILITIKARVLVMKKFDHSFKMCFIIYVLIIYMIKKLLLTLK